MKNEEQIRISKLMSFGLRHHPEKLGIQLDEHGWTDCEALCAAVRKRYPGFAMEDMRKIVSEDEKQRYSFSTDGTRIRANQGHSIPVDVELSQCEPPRYLFHGTGEKSASAILQEGLKPMSRLYVHLSWDTETARKVGMRHGRPVIFRIDAERMYRDGYVFFLSSNQVWLTKAVPPEYLEKL